MNPITITETGELNIKDGYAENYEVKGLEKDNENMLRVYCTQFPDQFLFQIRTFKPTAANRWNKSAKKKNMIAHVHLTPGHVRRILDYMEKYSKGHFNKKSRPPKSR